MRLLRGSESLSRPFITYLLRGCLDSSSLLSSHRVRLKSALDTATAAQDNHLRALIIALTSAHYVHTASDHAKMMLDTARQLASGMGAPSTKSASSQSEAVGNAPLGLWVGEKFHGTMIPRCPSSGHADW